MPVPPFLSPCVYYYDYLPPFQPSQTRWPSRGGRRSWHSVSLEERYVTGCPFPPERKLVL
jgi:hypothetical protein